MLKNVTFLTILIFLASCSTKPNASIELKRIDPETIVSAFKSIYKDSPDIYPSFSIKDSFLFFDSQEELTTMDSEGTTIALHLEYKANFSEYTIFVNCIDEERFSFNALLYLEFYKFNSKDKEHEYLYYCKLIINKSANETNSITEEVCKNIAKRIGHSIEYKCLSYMFLAYDKDAIISDFDW